MRRVLVLASMMIFFDVVFFAAIAPLLPDYVAEFGLSEGQAGVLTASYAAGTLVVALPAGFLASRIGPRRTVILGLILIGTASVVFGFAGNIFLLDSTRFVQGAGGAMIWAGALTWLISVAPEGRRGAVIGTALGTAVAGALIGPVIGGVAAQIGTEVVFTAVFFIALVFAALAARLPEAEISERQTFSEAWSTLISKPILVAAAFVAIPSLMFGVVGVLVPLRIDDLGGSHGVIVGGFVAGAALEATMAPIVGRYSDRHGRRAPFVAGTAVCGVAMLVFAASRHLDLVMATLALSSLGAGLCFSPALASLSEVAERFRLHQGVAAGLSNMAWASGQVVGAAAGGALAGVAGFATPSIAVAALMALTAVVAHRTLAPTASSLDGSLSG